MSIALLILMGAVPDGACAGLTGNQCAQKLDLDARTCLLAVPNQPDTDYCYGVTCTEETESCCDEDAEPSLDQQETLRGRS